MASKAQRRSVPPAMKTFGGLSMVAGHPALDFVNTVEFRMEAQPGDRLGSFEQLARWCTAADLISHNESLTILAQAALHPRHAGRTLARAVELREALHSVLIARIREAHLPGRAAKLIALWLRDARAGSELLYDPVASTFSWFAPLEAVEDVLVRLAESVDSLLMSAGPVTIRQCGGPRCDWLFLDRSHGHRRIWCQPDKCGNIVRVRRFRGQ
jgi:predicted RNA-binding Zn ribbon-like protein